MLPGKPRSEASIILHVSPEDLSAGAVNAVMNIDRTLSGLPPEDRVIIAAESFLGVLREFRLLAQKDPDGRKATIPCVKTCKSGSGGR